MGSAQTVKRLWVIRERFEVLGVNHFQAYFAFVEQIEAWHDSLNLIRPIFRVNDLFLEAVLIGLVENKIRRQPIIKKGVFILEDDLNFIVLFFDEEFSIEQQVMIIVLNVPRL